MRINKRLEILAKFFLITVICISIGIVFTAKGSRNIAGAESGETTGIKDSQGLDFIVIDNDIYEKDRKGPVYLEHKKHAREYGVSCWECHHDYDNDGENLWSPWEETQKCMECHDPEEEWENILKLQTAYHVTCKDCHKEKAIFGDDPLAYRKCTTCHEKTE